MGIYTIDRYFMCDNTKRHKTGASTRRAVLLIRPQCVLLSRKANGEVIYCFLLTEPIPSL